MSDTNPVQIETVTVPSLIPDEVLALASLGRFLWLGGLDEAGREIFLAMEDVVTRGEEFAFVYGS